MVYGLYVYPFVSLHHLLCVHFMHNEIKRCSWFWKISSIVEPQSHYHQQEQQQEQQKLVPNSNIIWSKISHHAHRRTIISMIIITIIITHIKFISLIQFKIFSGVYTWSWLLIAFIQCIASFYIFSASSWTSCCCWWRWSMFLYSNQSQKQNKN